MNTVLVGIIPVNLIGQWSGFLAIPTSAYTDILHTEYRGFDGYRSTIDWNIYEKKEIHAGHSQDYIMNYIPPLVLFQDWQSILTVVEFVSVIEELHLVEQN